MNEPTIEQRRAELQALLQPCNGIRVNPYEYHATDCPCAICRSERKQPDANYRLIQIQREEYGI